MPSIFITGPVRSGKSRFAERLARERGGDVAYVATARRDPSDPEWEERIARHAARRPKKWRVVETASDAPSLEDVCRNAPATLTLVVDSFGTWLAARMSPESDPALLEAHAEMVVGALLATKAHAIVVGDEVGWGIVPDYASGRVFRDVLGRAQQRLATESSRAYVVVAGFALDLHLGIPVDP